MQTTMIGCSPDAPEALPAVWAAAVAAATDMQLSATPAFGGTRPDASWLADALPEVLSLLPESTQPPDGSSSSSSSRTTTITSIQASVLLQVIDAAEGLLRQHAQQVEAGSQQQQQQPEGDALHSDADLREFVAVLADIMPAGGEELEELVLSGLEAGASVVSRQRPAEAAEVLLLELAACMARTALNSSSSSHLFPVEALQRLLALASSTNLLRSVGAGTLTAVAEGLQTVVQAGAAQDSLQAYSLIQQQASTQLVAEGAAAELHWAAVAGAATAAASGRSSANLLQLWPTAVAALEDVQLQRLGVVKRACSAVVRALAANRVLQQQLLAAPLPPALLQHVLEAAAAAATADALPPQKQGQARQEAAVLSQTAAVLLMHAQRHHKLDGVCTADTLSGVVRVVLTAPSPLSLLVVLPALSGLLQQGAIRPAPQGQPGIAELLLQCSALDPLGPSMLLTWLAENVASAPAGVQQLLCDMLAATTAQTSASTASADGHAGMAWQLFSLLQAQSTLEVEPQQLLPICSALIEQGQQQLGSASSLSDGDNRSAATTLQVWAFVKQARPTAATTDSFYSLSQQAQQVVLSSLVLTDGQEEALQLAQVQPATLQQLAELWKQQPAAAVPAHLFVQALQACVAQGDKQAAAMAAQLWSLLQRRNQQQQETEQQRGARLEDAAAAQLVQLLSIHGQLPTALKAYEACSTLQAPSDSEHSSEHTRTALSSLAAAVAAHGSSAQQQQLLHLLARTPGALSVLQPVVVELLSQAGSRSGSTVTLGLLLQAATQCSRGSKQPVLQLVGPQGVQQLCSLLTSQGTNAAAGDRPLLALPSPVSLAAECLQEGASAAATLAVPLLNAIAECHPELQPAAAAAALGVTGQPAAAGPATSGGGSGGSAQQAASSAADVGRASRIVAQLCSALQQTDGRDSSTPAGEQATFPWISKLSADAAAVALFAAWHQGSRQPNSAAAASGSGAAAPEAAAAAAGVTRLCLALYSHIKAAERPSAESLVPDLGLIAAAAVAQGQDWDSQEDEEMCWDEGLRIIGAAERALQDNSSSSSRSSSSTGASWFPAIPAAQIALVSVLVRTQGVEAAGAALLNAGAQLQEQPAAHSSKRQKKGASRPAAASAPPAAAPGSSVLSVGLLNSFLTAAVEAASNAGNEDDAAEMAAGPAIAAATKLCPYLVELMSSSSSSSMSTTSSTVGLRPDALTLLLLSALHLVSGSDLQAKQALMAALAQRQKRRQQQLPKAEQQRWADMLQSVLAVLAAACSSEKATVQLLGALVAGGVTAVSNPRLAEQLVNSVESQALAQVFEGEDPEIRLLSLAEGESNESVKLREQEDAAAAFANFRAALRSVELSAQDPAAIFEVFKAALAAAAER